MMVMVMMMMVIMMLCTFSLSSAVDTTGRGTHAFEPPSDLYEVPIQIKNHNNSKEHVCMYIHNKQHSMSLKVENMIISSSSGSII